MKKLYCLSIAILLICISTTVNAASFEANLTSSLQKFKAGQTVTLTLSVENIDAGPDGITSLQGTIDYDTAIFEKLTIGDLKAQGLWTLNTSNGFVASNNQFNIENTSGTKNNEAVLKIELKAKNTISLSSALITIANLKAFDGQDEISTSSAKITLAVDKPVDTTVNTNTTTNTTANEELPETGINDTIMYVLGIAVIWGIASMILYKKYNAIKI